MNLRNINVADLQSAAFDRLAILPKTVKLMLSLLKKKQKLHNIKSTLNTLESKLILKDKIKKNRISKDADISFPVFFKGINHFTLNGIKIRKKKKLTHINQTLTIQSKLSKQTIKITVNTNCPLIKIR